MFKRIRLGSVAKVLVILAIIVAGYIKISSIDFEPYSDMLSENDATVSEIEATDSQETPAIISSSPSPTMTASPDITPSPPVQEALKPSGIFAMPSPEPTLEPTPSPTPDVIESEEVVVGDGEAFIDFSSADLGHIYYAFNTDKYALIMMEHDGVVEYSDLRHDGTLERVSLALGSGDYRVVIYENISGNSFKVIEAAEFSASLENELLPFMVPTTMVYYDSSMQCIEQASWIASNEVNDEDAAEAIYDWIVENIIYDFDIYGTLQAGYIPDAEYTFINKKGICYDFAVLYAAMCRSQQIPCRVVHGYSDYVTGFHAWNEVYFDGEYHIVDTSTDAQTGERPFTRDEGYYPEKYS